MGRAPCCDKANVKKGPWAPEEDAKLKAYIEQHGTGGNWIALPQKIGLKRCGKSCRLRWLNYLRPNIKHGGFTEEEDNIICSLYISIGSRWSIIAAQLPGRTDNDIKNYWNTRLKKKLLGRRKHSNRSCSIPGQNSNNNNKDDILAENIGVDLSTSALERLQLHMQLQNPISYYNNPTLWPKMMNPLMMHQALLNQNNLPNNHYHNTIDPHQPNYSSSLKAGIDDSAVSGNNFSSPESSFSALNGIDQHVFQESSLMEQKINTAMGHLSSGFTNTQSADIIDDLLTNNDDKFFNGSKYNLEWWGELDAVSTPSSSNPWIHRSEADEDYNLMGYAGVCIE